MVTLLQVNCTGKTYSSLNAMLLFGDCFCTKHISFMSEAIKTKHNKKLRSIRKAVYLLTDKQQIMATLPIFILKSKFDRYGPAKLITGL